MIKKSSCNPINSNNPAPQPTTTFFLKSPDTDEALCEPKDFVDAIVNVEDEYFLEPYVENVVPW